MMHAGHEAFRARARNTIGLHRSMAVAPSGVLG